MGDFQVLLILLTKTLTFMVAINAFRTPHSALKTAALLLLYNIP